MTGLDSLFVEVLYNEDLWWGRIDEQHVFGRKTNGRRLEVRFVPAPGASFAEVSVFEGEKTLTHARRLLFNQNNLVDGFPIRVYRERQTWAQVLADFRRQVEPARAQAEGLGLKAQ